MPWLFDANWARVSVILVSVWLTTPYFFLVSLGALQSIPHELTEAARVDGGGGWAIFRRVTLPLLLVAVAPLMIASFAFNFNNFSNIYLLTGGGPYTGTSSVAGSTDILITYTYKLAIATGKGQDYGLASAVGDRHLLHRGVDLRHLVLPLQVTGEPGMTTGESELDTALAAQVVARTTRATAGTAAEDQLKDNWWRHVVALIAASSSRSSRSSSSSRRRSTATTRCRARS